LFQGLLELFFRGEDFPVKESGIHRFLKDFDIRKKAL
jgi:hypothetical protein